MKNLQPSLACILVIGQYILVKDRSTVVRTTRDENVFCITDPSRSHLPDLPCRRSDARRSLRGDVPVTIAKHTSTPVQVLVVIVVTHREP